MSQYMHSKLNASGVRPSCLLVLVLAAILFIAAPSYVYAAAGRDNTERVLDQANLFTAKEKEGLEQQVKAGQDASGMDLVVLTISDADGKTAQEYADDYYDEHDFGTGSDHSGALYLIDMDNREIAVSTLGRMTRYLTDERVDRILDAAYKKVSEGQYAASAQAAIGGITAYVKTGIPDGQYNYDSETGKVDSYNPRSITWYNVLFALVAAGVIALLPCIATRNQYKMRTEHRQALNYRMSYRSGSAFAFHNANDLFVNRIVTRRRIQRDSNSSSGPGGLSGRSTTHTSSSGRSHGGGSRKF